jgi:hypothetical protein
MNTDVQVMVLPTSIFAAMPLGAVKNLAITPTAA